MKLEDIIAEWKNDSNIDKTDLSEEAIKVPKLHHKYYEMLVMERLLLRKKDSEYKTLKLEKYEFYFQGHNEETRKKGWELPARGTILKSDIPLYLEADKDLINLSLAIGYQQEKIDFLESILKTIMNRGYLLRSIIDWTKFTMGA